MVVTLIAPGVDDEPFPDSTPSPDLHQLALSIPLPMREVSWYIYIQSHQPRLLGRCLVILLTRHVNISTVLTKEEVFAALSISLPARTTLWARLNSKHTKQHEVLQ